MIVHSMKIKIKRLHDLLQKALISLNSPIIKRPCVLIRLCQRYNCF